MQIRILIERRWQHAGEEYPLRVGEVHDLPDPVAAAFVATGAGERVEREAEPAPVQGRRGRR